MKQYGLIGGAVLVFVGGALCILASGSIWSPLPYINFIMALLVASTPINNPELPFRTFWLSAIGSLPMTLVYLAWSRKPINQLLIPKRSIVLLVLVIALSLLWFVFFWGEGVKWQGFRYTFTLAVINTIFALLAVAVLYKHRSSPLPRYSLVFHVALFVWLAWFAFPLLGFFLCDIGKYLQCLKAV